MKRMVHEENCPLDGFNPCREMKCAWYVKVRGTDSNTGEEYDHYGCAISWMPVLLIEGAIASRQTGASVESFRNEMVKSNNISIELLYRKLIGDGNQ